MTYLAQAHAILAAAPKLDRLDVNALVITDVRRDGSLVLSGQRRVARLPVVIRCMPHEFEATQPYG
ncbi:hypothetical protein H8Z72_22690 (plasmid) [Xanthomonas citri pv. citri]|uniref:hypothetical protein n=1 Tax=Xanthomonas citri TaxID=346 RepID=UPI0019348AA0|nr:hypothetical protein [Xanthomonas citri]QRD62662.1 hypothetical protein H8Z74_23495 [Xanthomonas citri pv. citri]QRD67197.1 hypothetical protein H8Z73_22475 [Xanthomonas citri pv. citri]QRD71758.1 hypothetical protein H8Z72_22690 [Xanthomonas citri pv. citri]